MISLYYDYTNKRVSKETFINIYPFFIIYNKKYHIIWYISHRYITKNDIYLKKEYGNKGNNNKRI